MTKAAIKAILFDMGNVLVELGGEDEFLAMLGEDMTRDEMWRRWLTSPSVRAHETGRMGEDEFAHRAVREFELQVAPNEFLAAFSRWIRGPFPGALELLDEARSRYTTALVTNVSAHHWPRIQSWGLPDRVHHSIASFEIGEIKPDPAYFARALDIVGVAPHEAVFLDDARMNVEAAQVFGLKAHRVVGVEQARAALQALDLL